MAQLLPPVPKEPIEPDSRIWREWFNKVRNVIVGTAQGVISWASLNFDGSNITDIVTRNHNDLQTIQGGTANQYYHLTATQLTNLGTVTTVSVATSNGFAGTVATATTTPVITLSTSVTGLLKGNGTAISAATSGTDYAPATSGTSILYGNGSGGFSNVTIGTGVSFAAGTLSATGSGGDVVGPASATDNAVVRFNLTTGKLIQNSGVIIDDTNNISDVLSQQFADGTAVTLAAGKMWYNATTGSWNLGMGNGNITQQVGEELFVYGKASAAITDSPLQIIYHTGVIGASGVITFAPTIAGITDSSAIVGIATESLALNDFGRATTFGTVRGITTNGTAFGETWADDDVIWYNPVTGNPTKVAPVAPYIKIQVGTVIKAGSGGSGSFHVEIIRGSTLGGTDSNVQFSGLANNNLIQYNSTLGYWTNVTPATVTGIGSVANAVTFNNGGAGAASGTTFDGSVARTISYNTIGAQVSGTYVTSVTGTAPVVSSGGTTPAISMAAATTSVSGYLTSTDWTTFNNKGSGTVTSVSGTAGRVSSTGGTTPVIDLVSGIASAGTTGSASLIPVVTIDTYGRVTSITTAANPQGTVTSVGGTGTVNGLSLSGTVTSSGNLTLGGTLDLSSPPAIGGTTASTGKFTTLTASGDLSAVNTITVTNSAAAYGNSNNFIWFRNSSGSTVGGITHPAVTTLGLWGNTGVRVLNGSAAAATIADFTSTGLTVTGTITPSIDIQFGAGGTSFYNNQILRHTNNILYIQGGTSGIQLNRDSSRLDTIDIGSTANQIDVQTNGVTRTRTTNSGLAVTGTLSATNGLTVTKSSNTAASITQTGATGYGLTIIPGADTVYDAFAINNAANTVNNILMYGNGTAIFKGGVGIGGAASPGSTGLAVTGLMSATTGQFTGASLPASGAGIEIFYSGGSGWIQGYNRTGSAYIGNIYDALNHQWNISGSSKMTLDASGILSNTAAIISGTYIKASSYLWAAGAGGAGGVYLGSAGATNGLISQASSGSGTTSTYIGNALITAVSDSRLKENVVDTTRNAIEILEQLRVVDHTWNDPSDQCENNRNSRGVWMGLIAQEAQPVIPWLVNKPTKDVDEDGNPQYWHMDYGYSVPLLIKAIQELNVITRAQAQTIDSLIARIVALENK